MNNPHSLRLEAMKEKHLEAIQVLEQESFSVPWTKAMFVEELKNPLALYYVLLVGDAVAGYAGLWSIHGEGHITNIAVGKAFRRQGFGRKLLIHLLERGEAVGITDFTLEVRRGNVEALALYESCGFVAAGVRKNYYSDNGEDAVLMWRHHD